jgi:ribosomal protein RSM22 (predicted rRNA methylase)
VTDDARLRPALDGLVGTIPGSQLKAAAGRLSGAYRALGAPGAMSEPEAVAYAVTRMPATLAAARSALSEARDALGLDGPQPVSQLDLGGGTGGTALAARGVWPGIATVDLMEQDPAMTGVGRRVLEAVGMPAQWTEEDIIRWARLRHETDAPAADLVTVAYVVGELASHDAGTLVRAAHRAAGMLLLVLEPGTPTGFESIRRARTALIEQGASVVAPCPHDGPCPMEGSDWCHFATRLERSGTHRRLKGGDLSYEDEKFSYVVVRPGPAGPRLPRIVRHPRRMKGHVEVSLCAPRGLETRMVTRSSGRYREAMKASWGSTWAE